MGAGKVIGRALGWILPALGLVVLIFAAVLLIYLLAGGCVRDLC